MVRDTRPEAGRESGQRGRPIGQHRIRAADEGSGEHRVAHRRVLEAALRHRWLDQSRRQRVDPDALPRVVDGRPITPCFAATYGAIAGSAMTPAMDAVLTIAQPPARIWYLRQRITPFRSTDSTLSNVDSS